MVKPRGKKRENANQLIKEKEKKLQKFCDSVRDQCNELETHLQAECARVCDRIEKLYAAKKNTLPENIRNMTLTEYLAMQQQEAEKPNLEDNIKELKIMSSIRSQYERSKLDSEKKKTLKKNRSERKRSVSVCSSKKGFPPNLPRISRVMSDSCLNTPQSKHSIAHTSFVVTPKFNPRAPVIKGLKRKPKVGEVILSMSGSPLLNLVDDIAEKPGVSLSLGGGHIINITEDTEIAKLEDGFMKKLNEETKSTLANIKQKLDLLLV